MNNNTYIVTLVVIVNKELLLLANTDAVNLII